MNYKCKHCGGKEFTFERKTVEWSDIVSFYDDGNGYIYIDDHEYVDGHVDDEPGIITCDECNSEWLEQDSKDHLIKEEEE